jgi:4,5:9,10-diseco-3-hydroxy-5,9,17-trioxoandrosta-1(10),2-diene-4-oate hydrolase
MTSLEVPQDHFVKTGDLRIRFIEQGTGHPVIFLHGGSLGSSADVFIRNLRDFAAAGYRAIAYDQPGFGLSDVPSDHSVRFRRDHLLAFMDALGIQNAALVAHSQAGSIGVQLALNAPDRVTHLVILGTGSLLPPLEEAREGMEAVAQQRLERRMATHEPALADTRKLLEANLFHHELITDEELALRHACSIGRCFEAFVARSADPAPAKKTDAKPLWQRLTELRQPCLLIFGREDRANAFERATRLKQMFPQLNLHIANGCKHLVPWDAQALVKELAVACLSNQ